jgi:transposase
MARRLTLSFSEEAQQAWARERYEHPHPRVHQRMETLWRLSHGVTLVEAARLAGVSRATAARYLAPYRQGGLEALREGHWEGPPRALEAQRATLEESFRKEPPHTSAEACARIQAETGVARRPTAVRTFLKKVWA